MSRYITYVYEIVDEAKYAKQRNPFVEKIEGVQCVGMYIGDLMEWQMKAEAMFPELEKIPRE